LQARPNPSHRGLRPPLLIAARSFVRGKSRFAMHIRTFGQERRVSARRGFVNRVCNCNATDSAPRARMRGVDTRGDYAPRCCERVVVQRGRRFLRRTGVVQPGAAGVSQPWYERRIVRGKRNHCARIARRWRCLSERRGLTSRPESRRGKLRPSCRCVSEPRGAYAPRS
jgi:hypothetical protein